MNNKKQNHTSSIQLKFYTPHPIQLQIIDDPHRFKVVSAGRRLGKSILAAQELIPDAIEGYETGYFCYSYKALKEVYRNVVRIVTPIISSKNGTDYRIELKTGGVIEFWSTRDPDSGRSRKYKKVIVDEAGIITNLEEAWNNTIRATLADYRGSAYFLGTPKGRNFFYKLYCMGKDERFKNWTSFQFPTSGSKYISKQELEEIRLSLPERVWRQEYLAEFLSDDGAVFRNIHACVLEEEELTEAKFGHYYIISVDWGRNEDFTVFLVFDIKERKVVKIDRFTGVDFPTQISRLLELYRKFMPILILAESNSIGTPQIEHIQKLNLNEEEEIEHKNNKWDKQFVNEVESTVKSLSSLNIPIQGFLTTNSTKNYIIDALSLAFESKNITIPNDEILINELMGYEQERTRSGRVTYNAPSGLTDDIVMALAIANYGSETGSFEIINKGRWM